MSLRLFSSVLVRRKRAKKDENGRKKTKKDEKRRKLFFSNWKFYLLLKMILRHFPRAEVIIVGLPYCQVSQLFLHLTSQLHFVVSPT